MNQNAIITLADAKYFPMLEELVDSINTHEQSKKNFNVFQMQGCKRQNTNLNLLSYKTWEDQKQTRNQRDKLIIFDTLKL